MVCCLVFDFYGMPAVYGKFLVLMGVTAMFHKAEVDDFRRLPDTVIVFSRLLSLIFT